MLLVINVCVPCKLMHYLRTTVHLQRTFATTLHTFEPYKSNDIVLIFKTFPAYMSLLSRRGSSLNTTIRPSPSLHWRICRVCWTVSEKMLNLQLWLLFVFHPSTFSWIFFYSLDLAVVSGGFEIHKFTIYALSLM